MTAYSLVERYKCFGETCSLHFQGRSKKKVIKRPHAHPNATNDTLTLKNRGGKFIHSTGIYLTAYMASDPRRQ